MTGCPNPRKPDMPRFAVNLSLMFNELGFLDRFAAARAAGFDAVEFLFPYAFEPEQIAGRLQRYNQELVLFNLPAGDWAAGERGFACDPRRIGEFQDSVELALEYAPDLGVKRLHCLAGKLHPAVPPERAHATFVENLRFAAAKMAPYGIDILVDLNGLSCAEAAGVLDVPRGTILSRLHRARRRLEAMLLPELGRVQADDL